MATARKAIAVTPHASNPLTDGPCDALFVGAAGTVVCKTRDGASDVTFTLGSPGYVLAQVTHVRATSTATGILALYN